MFPLSTKFRNNTLLRSFNELIYFRNYTTLKTDEIRQTYLEYLDVSNIHTVKYRGVYVNYRLKHLDFTNLAVLDGTTAINGNSVLQYVIIRNTESIPSLTATGSMQGAFKIYVTGILYDTYLEHDVWSQLKSRLKKLTEFPADAEANGWD